MEATATLRGACVTLDDQPVLVDIDLEIGRGLTIVRGPNGAGKTTLLRVLAGLVPLSRGTRAAVDLLYLGHRPGLHRALSAAENLAFFARYRGADAGGVTAALAAWSVRADVPVERLSAGQRRRAALARIEVERGPPLVLLDEPFAELDDEAAALLARALERCVSDGRSLVLATHGRSELAASRTVTLDRGRAA